jgi:hypothetical protein
MDCWRTHTIYKLGGRHPSDMFPLYFYGGEANLLLVQGVTVDIFKKNRKNNRWVTVSPCTHMHTLHHSPYILPVFFEQPDQFPKTIASNDGTAYCNSSPQTTFEKHRYGIQHATPYWQHTIMLKKARSLSNQSISSTARAEGDITARIGQQSPHSRD